MTEKTCSYDRVVNAVAREGNTLVFINGNSGVSITKDVSFFDSLVSKFGIKRIVGVYSPDCNPDWIEADLAYLGFSDK